MADMATFCLERLCCQIMVIEDDDGMQDDPPPSTSNASMTATYHCDTSIQHNHCVMMSSLLALL